MMLKETGRALSSHIQKILCITLKQWMESFVTKKKLDKARELYDNVSIVGGIKTDAVQTFLIGPPVITA